MNGYGNGGTVITGGLQGSAVNRATEPVGNAGSAVQVGKRLAEELHQALAALEQRLSQILRDDPPTATGGRNDANVRPIPSSAFVGAISDTNTALETALARLQNIASRIDL